MAVKARVPSLDAVAEALRALYKPLPDGKGFVPDIEAVDGWNLEDVAGLRAALEAERSSKEGLQTKLHGFDGIDPKLARDLIAKRAEMANWTPDEKMREQIAAREKALQEKFEGEVAAERAKSARLLAILERKVVDASATAAIAKLKGVPELLLPHIKSRVKVVESGDDFVGRVLADDGKTFAVTRRSGATGDMSIEEL